MEILETIQILKYEKLKGRASRHKREKKMRQVLLDYMGNNTEVEVGNYVLRKGKYQNNPFVMIYDKGSFSRRTVWLEHNQGEYQNAEQREQGKQVESLWNGA